VILAAREGKTASYLAVLFLICIFPGLGAICYGYRNHLANKQLERERTEAAELKERERQEKRQDRKEAAALKLQYAADVKQEQIKQPFRGSGKRS
jgi:hypothetical protein